MRIGSDAHWIVRGRLLCSRAPRGPQELESMAKAGVTHVLSLVDGMEEESWAHDAGLTYLHSVMAEMGSPSPAQIQEALVQLVAALRSEGVCLLLHCHAGVGRAGVVAAAYLGARAGLSPEEAIAEVRGRRPGALWSQDKEIAVEEYLSAFADGRLRLEGERSCPGCDRKILGPEERCLRCSGSKSLDAFLGIGA